MSKIIVKKVHPEFFEDILTGKKNFEVRVADFNLTAGDALLLREWNALTEEFTGREILKQVNYVRLIAINKISPLENLLKHGVFLIGMENPDSDHLISGFRRENSSSVVRKHIVKSLKRIQAEEELPNEKE